MPSDVEMLLGRLNSIKRNVQEKEECTCCKRYKVLTSFDRRYGVRSNTCKNCESIIGDRPTKQLHKALSSLEKEKSRKSKSAKKRVSVNRAFVDHLKTKPCSDCGKSYPPVAMDFDHARGKKAGNISVLIFRVSMRGLLRELEKCDLVCATCHRLRTAHRHDMRKYRKELQDAGERLSREAAIIESFPSELKALAESLLRRSKVHYDAAISSDKANENPSSSGTNSGSD